MDNQCTVQVKLELGHRAQLRKKPTSEGFTHDWMVFVRGPEQCDIQHFVEKVVFRLHESFPKPKRVCKEPPYKVEESGYAGFIMPIEVYFKNKEEPKKVCFTYDLFLNLEGNPPVNHLRCEKLTFNNPTKEFRRKLVKAGGVMVMPEGAESVSRPSPDYPILPTIPLSAFSDPKKTKPSHGSKDVSKDGSGGGGGVAGGGGKASKPHKVTKEHRERPRKDSESKASAKNEMGEKETSKVPKDSPVARKPADSKSTKEESKAPPKAAFKEPKLTVKDSKLEGMSPKGGGGGGGGTGGGGGGSVESKGSSKRPSSVESPKPSTKKQKKGGSEGGKAPGLTGTSPRVSSSTSGASSAAPPPPSGFPEKKPPKDKGGSARWAKVKPETTEHKDVKKLLESEESNSEDEATSKSESVPSSPSNSSSSCDSSSDSDFQPSQNHSQGPLRSMVDSLGSEETDDDDSSSEEETPVKASSPNRDSRLNVDSESNSSEESPLPSRDPAPTQKHSSANNKVSGRKSPEPCSRPEKILKKGYDKAYTDELVDLHRRLMALRERNVLQQIVNLIEETGHFNVTNTTFDFDLFSLDESTVRKLQSYLEPTAT
ncbi:ENL protein, partial [Polypterus senegalus]|nr:protein ENL [Polypterus senegalus]MBN3289162.1 ENL protein [Polypterus senegalus]